MRQVLVVTLVVASALMACKQKEDDPAPDPAPVASAPAAPVAEAPAAPSASVADNKAAAPVAAPVGTTHTLPIASAGKPTSGVFEPSGFGHGTGTATPQPTATGTGGTAALVATPKPTSTAAATATAAPKPTSTATAAATGSAKPPKPKPSLFATGTDPATGSSKGTDKGSTGDAVHRNRTTHAPTRPGAHPK